MSLKENILKEAKRIEEDTEFSSEEHFITARRWSIIHYILGLLSAIFAVVSGGTVLTQFNESDFYVILGVGISSLLAGVFASILTFLNPNNRATCHLNAGNSYRELRNKVRIFREIDYLQDSDEILSKKLKELAAQRETLNKTNPQPPKWAYEKAKKRIEKGATSYKVDK
jgi:hypothetical protein